MGKEERSPSLYIGGGQQLLGVRWPLEGASTSPLFMVVVISLFMVVVTSIFMVVVTSTHP
jgi:hypothetical protein